MDIINQIQDQVTLLTLYYAFAFLVCFDIITGVIKAWKSGRMKSRTLRDGLFSSLGEMLMLVLCIFLVTLIEITGVIIYPMMVWMCFKELYSIIENLTVIGITLPTWLVKGLQVYTEKLDKGEK